jgi:hypothetical protein
VARVRISHEDICTIVSQLPEYAINGEDMEALGDGGIRTLFTDQEFDELVRRVRADLLPRLSAVRREWESNYSSDNSPEGHMQQLIEGFQTLKERFADEAMTVKKVEREIDHANDWIRDQMPDEPDEESSRSLGDVEATEKPQSARSIFDDIDAGDEVEDK